MQQLPDELIQLIAEHCDDVFALRLTCRRFSLITTPLAFSRLHICCFSFSITRLHHITHSALAKHVKTLTVYTNTLKEVQPGDFLNERLAVQELLRDRGATAAYKQLLKTLDTRLDDIALLPNLQELIIRNFEEVETPVLSRSMLPKLWGSKPLSIPAVRTIFSHLRRPRGPYQGQIMRQALQHCPTVLELDAGCTEDWHVPAVQPRKLTIRDIVPSGFLWTQQVTAEIMAVMSDKLTDLSLIDSRRFNRYDWSRILGVLQLLSLKRFEICRHKLRNVEIISFLQRHELERLQMVDCLVDSVDGVEMALEQLSCSKDVRGLIEPAY